MRWKLIVSSLLVHLKCLEVLLLFFKRKGKTKSIVKLRRKWKIREGRENRKWVYTKKVKIVNKVESW